MLSAGPREAVDGAGRGGSRARASLSSDDVHELYVRLQPHAETAPLQRLRQGRPGLQSPWNLVSMLLVGSSTFVARMIII